MKLSWDWKFAVGLVVALAGVAVPVFIWQVDLASRAVKVQVVSTTPLDPASPGKLTGLKLFFEDQEIKDSYLSTLEISNTGSRPILPVEFESPIEISLRSPSKLLSVEFAEAIPNDLIPKTTFKENMVLLSPLLLNPGDRIRLTVLSFEKIPQFAVRGRIAGITKIQFEEGRVISLHASLWKRGLLGAALFFGYLYLFLQGVKIYFREKRIPFMPIAGSFVSLFAANDFLRLLKIYLSTWEFVSILVFVAILAMALVGEIKKQPAKPNTIIS